MSKIILNTAQELPEGSKRKSFARLRKAMPKASASGNFAAYAFWTNPNPNNFIKTFRASWMVPMGPVLGTGSFFYLFNGLLISPFDAPSPNNRIIQPILCYSGGQWSVMCMYAGVNGSLIKQQEPDNPIPVNPGESLIGEINKISLAPNDYGYQCNLYLQAESITTPKITLQPNSADVPNQLMNTCVIALEPITVSQPADYPPNLIRFNIVNVELADGTTADCKWTAGGNPTPNIGEACTPNNYAKPQSVDILFSTQ